MGEKLLEKVFSIKNEYKNNKKYKVIRICGLKIKSNLSKNKGYIPYLETHLCDHCNLNCKGCGHCSPLVTKETFADIKVFAKDIKTLSKKLDINKIRLMGGEPLLHPDICKFVVVTRKAYPNAIIKIVTNGILIPQMPEKFWQTLRENRIFIDLSKYPPCAEKFDSYLDIIKKNNVQIDRISDASQFFNQVNIKGDSPIVETFNNCLSKYCVNLWRSKLYTCPACYTHYYNQYFGKNKPMPVAFDIYKLSGKELAQKLNKPIDFCRFCNTKELKYYKWDQSKKEIAEWD